MKNLSLKEIIILRRALDMWWDEVSNDACMGADIDLESVSKVFEPLSEKVNQAQAEIEAGMTEEERKDERNDPFYVEK